MRGSLAVTYFGIEGTLNYNNSIVRHLIDRE